MTAKELGEIGRRADYRQGVHIARWTKRMWLDSVQDTRALIQAVKEYRAEVAVIREEESERG